MAAITWPGVTAPSCWTVIPPTYSTPTVHRLRTRLTHGLRKASMVWARRFTAHSPSLAWAKAPREINIASNKADNLGIIPQRILLFSMRLNIITKVCIRVIYSHVYRKPIDHAKLPKSHFKILIGEVLVEC